LYFAFLAWSRTASLAQRQDEGAWFACQMYPLVENRITLIVG
jgi:hypothetical protein